jgi:hypothetical protein
MFQPETQRTRSVLARPEAFRTLRVFFFGSTDLEICLDNELAFAREETDPYATRRPLIVPRSWKLCVARQEESHAHMVAWLSS